MYVCLYVCLFVRTKSEQVLKLVPWIGWCSRLMSTCRGLMLDTAPQSSLPLSLPVLPTSMHCYCSTTIPIVTNLNALSLPLTVTTPSVTNPTGLSLLRCYSVTPSVSNHTALLQPYMYCYSITPSVAHPLHCQCSTAAIPSVGNHTGLSLPCCYSATPSVSNHTALLQPYMYCYSTTPSATNPLLCQCSTAPIPSVTNPTALLLFYYHSQCHQPDCTVTTVLLPLPLSAVMPTLTTLHSHNPLLPLPASLTPLWSLPYSYHSHSH